MVRDVNYGAVEGYDGGDDEDDIGFGCVGLNMLRHDVLL
jgi:hypothetical protein